LVLVIQQCSLEIETGRFHYYKIQEYSDFWKIKEDIGWRDIEKIKQYVFAVNWLPLEKVIDVVYRDLDSPDLDEAMSFFKERNLV
jgi:hypothetical protein